MREYKKALLKMEQILIDAIENMPEEQQSHRNSRFDKLLQEIKKYEKHINNGHGEAVFVDIAFIIGFSAGASALDFCDNDIEMLEEYEQNYDCIIFQRLMDVITNDLYPEAYEDED